MRKPPQSYYPLPSLVFGISKCRYTGGNYSLTTEARDMINVHYDGENLLPCLQRHTSLMYKYFKSKVNNIDWVGISNIEIIHRIVEKSTR